ncbi:phosphatase PAP2 family protein [Leuconostoc gelidum subsp. gelidum]|uniref:Phosphatase PAP2 family protein n=1 Tax=Leuconostoc gelidum subsp. gelidum TaxID=1607839 RepID=A0AB35FYV1_LEUGE|nr:phosphatase PAP2 family protein [Leuconostoc gelidum]MBZ5963787.1 phosphatase PAP2 family protein [Leuconostoc gelidum subsp. gelidum]MBZ5975370.1 phosphatase PAP2 family protein [Leuconostoc gelidum subsp. gelidum]MBZ5976459.1 phosphatase PAP2 family protein [Leuconostoc gelidum subsp. gelidum]MBZ5985500.1 phosphatase PAP2 family protein [Leuconostoc gelidum subsp. gelidum]MBZ6000441.1 phosphatase PAP2 family protein [Leuconostoc gelidum subsp. gelidum]
MIIKRKIRFFSVILAFSVFMGLLIGVKFQSQWLNNLNLAGQQLIQHRSVFADVSFTYITQLGSVTFTLILTVLLSLFFIYHQQYRLLAFLLVNVILFAGVVTQLIKYLVRNPRPIPQLLSEHGYSFPSGHTMIAILLYGTLIIIIQTKMQNSLLKYITIMMFLILIIAIPTSRIYVNVHYPSDILAGLALGYGLLIISQHLFQIGGKHT